MQCAGVCVVLWIYLASMASFDLPTFLSHPSSDQLEKCRKDDLIAIANHFQIPIKKQALKERIKSDVLNYLVETKVFLEMGVEGEGDIGSQGAGVTLPHMGEKQIGVTAGAVAEVAAEAGTKAGLPPFDPCSPISPGSPEGARLKVRLARLQFEAQDKIQARQAECDLRLEIRRLEIEAETQVKLRQLELDARKVDASPAAQLTPSNFRNVSSPPEPPVVSFDISKHIALVPHFRETEVDSYFGVFERIATSLQWPKDVWSLLLQCRLVGKAQEICSTLSLEERV